MNYKNDYEEVVTKGNLGFYQSCEITQIFLHNNKERSNYNIYTLVSFEELPFQDSNHKFLGGRLSLDKDHLISIHRYRLSLIETQNTFNILAEKNVWDFKGDQSLNLSKLRLIPKQYVRTNDGVRINKILKNNFNSGSYIIEFFDEQKASFDSFLNIGLVKKFNSICKKINEFSNIDLSINRDRIGNIVFQFPILILKTRSRSLKEWDGISLEFYWHHLLSKYPETYIQVESSLDGNYLASSIEDYNNLNSQTIKTGNSDSNNICKIIMKSPNLILGYFEGSFIKEFVVNVQATSDTPRLFDVDDESCKVNISSPTGMRKQETTQSYVSYINNNLYEFEKKQLERTLSFKQYLNEDHIKSIQDLRRLISENDKNGICLWDPFLSPNDILNTLFFSPTNNVKIKAIGSIGKTVKLIYEEKDKGNDELIEDYRNQFINSGSNNYGLNLEFRIQHSGFGWKFHDRFLIFPGNIRARTKAYSLGTSVNSFGKTHHILQEVSHPQPVLDTFNDLWDQLNNNNCIVWNSKD